MTATASFAAPLFTPAGTQADWLFLRIVERDDAGAFRELFQAFYAPLVKQAYWLVKVQEIAEEVVSDVFVRIWKNRGEIAIRTSIKPYLYRAVWNQALDYLKSLAHLADSHDQLPDAYVYTQADDVSPETALIQQEFSDRVELVVASLPGQCQSVFRLSRDRGLKYREIANELGLSIKTVETHMGRAFRVLRESLSDCR